MIRKLLQILGLLLLLPPLVSTPARAQDFTRATLEIYVGQSDRLRSTLPVEVASTLEERLRGLAHRDSLPPRHGMLFDFEEDRVMNMWMKEVSMPLDMLFMDSGGVIFRIVKNVQPFTVTIHSSERPGRYVLAVPAGHAFRLRVRLGDRCEFY